MTKVTVIGQQPEKKKIEFVKLLGVDGWEGFGSTPNNWDNIVLLSRLGDYDTMFAYNDSNPIDGCIYLGHFNDGVV